MCVNRLNQDVCILGMPACAYHQLHTLMHSKMLYMGTWLDSAVTGFSVLIAHTVRATTKIRVPVLQRGIQAETLFCVQDPLIMSTPLTVSSSCWTISLGFPHWFSYTVGKIARTNSQMKMVTVSSVCWMYKST